MAIPPGAFTWLRLIDQSGPFLSPQVLGDVFPQGLDTLPKGLRAQFVTAYDAWLDEKTGGAKQVASQTAWIEFVLRTLLDFPDDCLRFGQSLPPGCITTIAEEHETLRPDFVLANPPDHPEAKQPRLLIHVYPPGQRLDRKPADTRWEASCETRMQEHLRGTGLRLGLVTNGEQWCLVHVHPDQPTGFATWHADLWREEQDTLRAFRSLLGERRFFGVDAKKRQLLEQMYEDSAAAQQEVTDQLGVQVRNAIEILVRTFDRLDKDSQGQLLSAIPEPRLYEATVVVMMRLVFLLHAEEKGMFPLDDPFYADHYAASTLHPQLQERADRFGEEILERQFDAWGRLLALFRMIHGGVGHLSLPAYGGDLFDPDRYPFLEGRESGTRWHDTPGDPPAIDNRTVLHLLRAVQFLEMQVKGVGKETRRLSFRALDIEQIGHVYEGLLDHTAKRAGEDDPVLGLSGTRSKGEVREPEIPIRVLEAEQAKGEAKFLKFLKDETGRSETTLKKALAATPDDALVAKLRYACAKDDALFNAALPWLNLIRTDDLGHLLVIPPGSVYVTQGSDRRTTGTHYTPRSLTEPIVKHTLDPLVYDGPADGKVEADWVLKSPEEILRLRVCDIAMGSGAFLVQAARYLADRLLEAESLATPQSPGSPSLATPPGGDKGDADATLAAEEQRKQDALRRVVDRCIYGVDKNPLAVDMAKLSLWLITLQKDKAFTFLDHALKCGDSLLGLWRPEQISALHITPERTNRDTPVIWTERLRSLLTDSVSERVALAQSTVWQASDYEAKKQALERLENKQQLTKLICDWVTAAALATADGDSARRGHRPKEAYDEAVGLFANDVLNALNNEGIEQMTFICEWTEGIDEMLHDGELTGDLPRFFHWPMEFPEVFPPDAPSAQRGFDAIVGNPPFQGGQRITGALGTDYRFFLIDYLAKGQKGSADLCAYFFLRAFQLLRTQGNFGLLATNTIAQGDTREVGLDQLTAGEGRLVRAVPSRKWPGAASLEVAHVWLHKGDWQGKHVLNDLPARAITPYLTIPSRNTGKPHRLAANQNKSFQGSIVLGMGFVLEPEAAKTLIAKDPRNKEVLFPYLNGQDLNTHPQQQPSRWVINFHDWPIERAQEYPDCFEIVEQLVKPERAKLIGRNSIGTKRGKNWWLYGADAKNLYATIAGMSRVLVKTRHSPNCAFEFSSSDVVFQESMVVFAHNEHDTAGVLSTTIHELWAWENGSTLGGVTLRYGPSDCFETFPFPDALDALEDIGERYYTHRQEVMRQRWEGLTKTYNRFHDPSEAAADIARLRALHVEMDHAVAAAYGWSDLDLGHGFHDTKQGLRYTLHPTARQEVLDRLLELNFARHAEEVAAGLVDEHGKPLKKKAQSKQASGRRGRARKTDSIATLPGLEE